MKFIPLIALSAVILTGCGGSGGDSNSSDAVSSNGSNTSTGTEGTAPSTGGNSETTVAIVERPIQSLRLHRMILRILCFMPSIKLAHKSKTVAVQ